MINKNLIRGVLHMCTCLMSRCHDVIVTCLVVQFYDDVALQSQGLKSYTGADAFHG